MWHDTEYEGNFYEYNYSDSPSERDYAVLVGENKVQHGHKTPWEEEEEEEEEIDLEEDVQRFPAILRTNRQIYNEASSLLYSGLEVYLQASDVLCMNPSKDIVKASERVWRHNPLHGLGTTDKSGQTIYAKPALDGYMEPHVLARFTKIVFDLEFSWEAETLEAEVKQQTEEDQTALVAPSLFVNDDLTINPQDEAKLLAFYRRSTIIHQLVKILSNSSNIVRLMISIDIQVLARYDMDLDADSDSDSEEDDESIETTKKMAVANERAMYLFLDSGLLAPLEKLSNVQSLDFDFSSALDRNDEAYQPTSKHDSMLSDLKQRITRNYAVKDD